MTTAPNNFCNVLLCEDIRDEVGNKKSLMGVFGGDIIVPSFPANIQFAIYLQFVPDKSAGSELNIEFRLMRDDMEIAKGRIKADVSDKDIATITLPRGVAAFEKPAKFKMLACVNGGPETEVLSKQIMLTTSSSA